MNLLLRLISLGVFAGLISGGVAYAVHGGIYHDCADAVICWGTDGRDDMYGNGRDDIRAQDGADFVWADEAEDYVEGNGDQDRVRGNAEADVIVGGNGADFWNCSTEQPRDHPGPVGACGLNGDGSGDHLEGGPLWDFLRASDGRDDLHGQTGDDWLVAEPDGDYDLVRGGGDHDHCWVGTLDDYDCHVHEGSPP